MKKLLLLLLCSATLVSCSSKGLVGNYWDLLPNTIDSFGSFIKAWFILLIIDLTCSVLLITLGLKGRLVTIILFFLVLFRKDYGFFTTVFLFLFSGIILYIINIIWTKYVSKRND